MLASIQGGATPECITLASVAHHYRYVIVGAGPGGLAAAAALARSERCAPSDVLIVDAGGHQLRRERETPADITCGQGGAGLYSDGKFSFYPSATELWKLPATAELARAYEWYRTALSPFDVTAPPLQTEAIADIEPGSWELKEYPSIYLDLQQRERLVKQLARQGRVPLAERIQVNSCRWDQQRSLFALSLKDTLSSTVRRITADRLLLVPGRFGPTWLLDCDFVKPVFRRLEIGCRIEQPSTESFFYDLACVDPKLKYADQQAKVEWRTFCACRDGATVLSDTLGLWTVSGHSDGPPTALSNVGFNTRILDEAVAREAWTWMRRSLLDRSAYFELALAPLFAEQAPERERLAAVYGPVLAAHVVRGLRHLAERYPSLATGTARLIGPTLEGVGWYPETDSDLKIPGVPAWVAGDASGKFRGITAAMVSGFYVANRSLADAAAGAP